MSFLWIKALLVVLLVNTGKMIIESYFYKHLALGAWLDRRAVHRHGLSVPGKLQSELLLHQLPDHLRNERKKIHRNVRGRRNSHENNQNWNWQTSDTQKWGCGSRPKKFQVQLKWQTLHRFPHQQRALLVWFYRNTDTPKADWLMQKASHQHPKDVCEDSFPPLSKEMREAHLTRMCTMFHLILVDSRKMGTNLTFLY